MKSEIERYVESLYKELGDTQEVRDLKEEIRIHLEESASHLQSQGYSKDESIRLAIQRFDNNENPLGNSNGIYKTKLNKVKVAANKDAYVSLSLGVASILLPIIGIFLAVVGFLLIYRKNIGSVKRVRIWALTFCIMGLIIQITEII